MKKIIIILLLLASMIHLQSCQFIKSKYTVERIPLSKDEQRIADLAGYIVEKFTFEKDRVYDINIYLYKDNSIEITGAAFGVDTKGEAGTILIGGRTEGNTSFSWSFSDSGVIIKSAAIEIDDDREFMKIVGVGQEKFTMEEGKEYVLIFVAFKEGNQISTATTEPFITWDSVDDKAAALAEFDYAYIVTVRLSDTPGYK